MFDANSAALGDKKIVFPRSVSRGTFRSYVPAGGYNQPGKPQKNCIFNTNFEVFPTKIVRQGGQQVLRQPGLNKLPAGPSASSGQGEIGCGRGGRKSKSPPRLKAGETSSKASRARPLLRREPRRGFWRVKRRLRKCSEIRSRNVSRGTGGNYFRFLICDF